MFLNLHSAAAAPKAVEALTGRYAFDTDRKGGAGCTFTLQGDGANGEYALTLTDQCRRSFPFLDDVRAWLPRGDGLVFVYRVGGIAMEFTSIGQAEYSGSLRKGRETTGDSYILARYPDRPDDLSRWYEYLRGTWLLWARPEDGAPNCELRLEAQTAGRPTSVTLSPDCARIVPAASRVTAWALDHPWRIALLGKDGAAVLTLGWINYGAYGVAGDGPALTRVYGR